MLPSNQNLLFKKEENNQVKKNYLSSLELLAKKEKGSERGTHEDYAQHRALLCCPKRYVLGVVTHSSLSRVSFWRSPAPKRNNGELLDDGHRFGMF